jgi:serine phosphatase RsbU (regulator of sigma subunit)
MRGQRRLRARIAIVVLAGAIVVAVGLALLLSNTISLRNNSDATIRYDTYLLRVTTVERVVINAETGLRGYIITDRHEFLQPLATARATLRKANQQLLSSAAQTQAFIPRAHALATASTSYMTMYVPPVLALAAHNIRAARTFGVTLEGKRLVDSIRAQTQVLERLVSGRASDLLQDAHHSASESITEAIVALVALTALTVLLGGWLGRVAIGRERARGRSERTTRTLQRSLLPEEVPPIPGCELAVQFTPAAERDVVGGDFYDAFAAGSDRWAIVLGDVCGKGAEAASVTAMARWTLRSLSANPVEPADALRFLNETMLRQTLEGRFITIIYLLVAVHGDGAEVSVACAGHPPPILVPSTGEASAVAARGTLLGVFPHISLDTTTVHLGRGDSLVAYTDGVTDQGPGLVRLDLPRLFRGRGAGTSAEDLTRTVAGAAQRAPGPQRDDIAIIALRYTGEKANVEGPVASSASATPAGARAISPHDLPAGDIERDPRDP